MWLNAFATFEAGRWSCSRPVVVDALLIERGDATVTLPVVVVGVEHDLAGERLHRHLLVGPEGNRHDHDVARRSIRHRSCRGVRAEVRGERLESLRAS